MQAKIQQLFSYPIKSCGSISHRVAEINSMGIKYDRNWMLVDTDGLFVSQRKLPQLALIKPVIEAQKLRVNAPGMAELSIQIEDVPSNMDVTVWRDTLSAEVSHESVNRWFSEYLKTEVFLVRYGAKSQRQIDPEFASPDQTVAFADGFPLLVCHQSSLQALNQSLSQAIGMNRFRPNVVVASAHGAWDECHWHQLSNENLILELVKPCSRCVITGVEQSTGVQTGSEVLKTLKNKFSFNEQAIFGINAIPNIIGKSIGQLAVGMTLEVSQHQESK